MLFKIMFLLVDDVLDEKIFTQEEIIFGTHLQWVKDRQQSINEIDQACSRFKLTVC